MVRKHMSVYEELGEERKRLQEEGKLPEWVTTPSYQLLKENYLSEKWPDLHSVYSRVANHAATYTDEPDIWAPRFFDLLWNGYLAASTPILSNMGTGIGCPVSCSGGVISDSVESFYEGQKEAAILSKNGFGTSAYLGAIRPRGSKINGIKGSASGVLPVFKDFVQMSRDISQGSCYDNTTEILTENGWMLFDDLIYNSNDGNYIKVASVDDNNIVDFVLPSDYIKTKYDGMLINFKDSKNINISVTPNHTMPYYKGRRSKETNGKYIFDIPKIDRADTIQLYNIKKIFKHSGMAKSGDGLSNFDKLLIAYQADGCKVLDSKFAFKFNLKKKRKIDRLGELLDSLNISYTKNTYQDGVTKFYINGLHIPISKTFDWVDDLSEISNQWATEFIDELLFWDGDQISEYTSTIKFNVDIAQSISAICGYKSKFSIKSDKRTDSIRNPLYRLKLSNGDSFGTDSIIKSEIKYTDFVYCVTVPTGKVIVRSNGHTLVCGNSRRGAWAGYIEIDHGDFYELANHVLKNPDDANIGWIVSNAFIDRLNSGDVDAIERYQKSLKLKMITGKGYYLFIDKVNRQNPVMYKNLDLLVKASNLCAEIMLFSDEFYTFSCVLSSMNITLYNKWKDTKAVFDATVFLDCVNQDLISIGRNIPGMEKIVRFAEHSRALGLGVLGFATYLQDESIPFESIDAHYKNTEIFKFIDAESLRASKWLAKYNGEPRWCIGHGVANTHRMAIPPTLSSALVCGAVSQGIEPIYKNAYVQNTAAGKIDRVNPTLLKLMKEKGVYNEDTIRTIIQDNGSVQNVSWLTDHEKAVFKTAFEIDQKVIIRLASARQRYVDQGQSINLFFSADEKEEYISEVHKMAFLDPYIKSLYYIRSESGVQVNKESCVACEG